MDNAEATESVKRFVDSIRDSYKPLMVVLYGSCARCTQTPSSHDDPSGFVSTIMSTGEIIYESYD